VSEARANMSETLTIIEAVRKRPAVDYKPWRSLAPDRGERALVDFLTRRAERLGWWAWRSERDLLLEDELRSHTGHGTVISFAPDPTIFKDVNAVQASSASFRPPGARCKFARRSASHARERSPCWASSTAFAYPEVNTSTPFEPLSLTPGRSSIAGGSASSRSRCTSTGSVRRPDPGGARRLKASATAFAKRSFKPS